MMIRGKSHLSDFQCGTKPECSIEWTKEKPAHISCYLASSIAASSCCLSLHRTSSHNTLTKLHKPILSNNHLAHIHQGTISNPTRKAKTTKTSLGETMEEIGFLPRCVIQGARSWENCLQRGLSLYCRPSRRLILPQEGLTLTKAVHITPADRGIPRMSVIL